MLKAEPEIVRSRDVRRRPLQIVSIGRLLVFAASGRNRDGVTRRPKGGVSVRSPGEPGGRTPLLFDPRLIQILVAFDVARKTALDEQLVADRRRPFGRAREVERRGPDDRR